MKHLNNFSSATFEPPFINLTNEISLQIYRYQFIDIVGKSTARHGMMMFKVCVG